MLTEQQRLAICTSPIVCAAKPHNGLFCGIVRLAGADPSLPPILVTPNVYTTRAIAEASMSALVTSIRRADGSSN